MGPWVLSCLFTASPTDMGIRLYPVLCNVMPQHGASREFPVLSFYPSDRPSCFVGQKPCPFLPNVILRKFDGGDFNSAKWVD